MLLARKIITDFRARISPTAVIDAKTSILYEDPEYTAAIPNICLIILSSVRHRRKSAYRDVAFAEGYYMYQTHAPPTSIAIPLGPVAVIKINETR